MRHSGALGGDSSWAQEFSDWEPRGAHHPISPACCKPAPHAGAMENSHGSKRPPTDRTLFQSGSRHGESLQRSTRFLLSCADP